MTMNCFSSFLSVHFCRCGIKTIPQIGINGTSGCVSVCVCVSCVREGKWHRVGMENARIRFFLKWRQRLTNVERQIVNKSNNSRRAHIELKGEHRTFETFSCGLLENCDMYCRRRHSTMEDIFIGVEKWHYYYEMTAFAKWKTRTHKIERKIFVDCPQVLSYDDDDENKFIAEANYYLSDSITCRSYRRTQRDATGDNNQYMLKIIDKQKNV